MRAKFEIDNRIRTQLSTGGRFIEIYYTDDPKLTSEILVDLPFIDWRIKQAKLSLMAKRARLAHRGLVEP